MRHRQRFAAIVIVATLAGCAGTQRIRRRCASQQRRAPPISMKRYARAQRRADAGEHEERSCEPQRASSSAGYPVTADPPVPVPNEEPCVDNLFNPNTPPLTSGGLPVGDFADYSNHPFDYTPPANCPGPTRRSFSKCISALRRAAVRSHRRRMDRRHQVFFGTTSEPGPKASPEWTIERDVSEYAPIFAQPGKVWPPSITSSTNVYRHHLRSRRARLLSREQQFKPRECRRRLSDGRQFRRRLRLSGRSERSDDGDVHLPAKRRSGVSRRLLGIAIGRRILVHVLPRRPRKETQ